MIISKNALVVLVFLLAVANVGLVGVFFAKPIVCETTEAMVESLADLNVRLLVLEGTH